MWSVLPGIEILFFGNTINSQQVNIELFLPNPDSIVSVEDLTCFFREKTLPVLFFKILNMQGILIQAAELK